MIFRHSGKGIHYVSMDVHSLHSTSEQANCPIKIFFFARIAPRLSPICSSKVNARTILHLVKVTWITAADIRMPGIFCSLLSHVVQVWAFGQESCQCDPAEECMIAESRPLGIIFETATLHSEVTLFSSRKITTTRHSPRPWIKSRKSDTIFWLRE